MSPALAGEFFTTEPPGEPQHCVQCVYVKLTYFMSASLGYEPHEGTLGRFFCSMCEICTQEFAEQMH